MPARACASAIVKRFSLYSVTGFFSFWLFSRMSGVLAGPLPARGSCLAARAAGLRVLGGAVAGDAFGLCPEGFVGGGEVRVLGRSEDAFDGRVEAKVFGQVQGIAPAMSASTVRRILAADTIKPWQYRSWLFIRDPGLRRQGRPGPGPLRAGLRRQLARRRRIRDLLR